MDQNSFYKGTPVDDGFRLNDFLPYRLAVLSNRISRSIADLYETRFGVTLNEWRVLAVLGEDKHGLSAGEVATRAAMDKVAVSRALQSLRAKDLIIQKIATGDRRKALITHSKAGIAAYTEILPLARRFEAQLLGKITQHDQEQLDGLLTLLERALIDIAASN